MSERYRSSKLKNKDKTCVKRAQGRLASPSVIAFTSREELVEKMNKLFSAKTDAEAFLLYSGDKEFRPTWNKQLTEIQNLSEWEEWEEVEKRSSALLDETEAYMAPLMKGIHYDPKRNGRFPVIGQDRWAFSLRGQARLNNGNPKGAVDDLTACLAYVGMCKDKDEVENGDSCILNPGNIEVLRLRAVALKRIGDYDGAVTDARACCAAIRWHGSQWEACGGDSQTKEEMGDMLQMLMAQQKYKEKALRPHYTPEERDSIEKELGVNSYSPDMYRCLGCDSEPSDTVTLHRCSRCQNVWLCSKECMKKAWAAGHKQRCRKSEGSRHFNDVTRVLIDETFKLGGTGGMVVYKLQSGQSSAVMMDPVTGRYFESLSDDDIFFYPSEDVLLPGGQQSTVEDLHLGALHLGGNANDR